MDNQPQPVHDTTTDHLLEFLVSVAQEAGIGFSMTLAVGGGVITGQLVGRDRWVELLGEDLDRAGEHGAALGSAITEFLQGLDLHGQPPAPSEDEAPVIRYGFIHLADARWIVGPVGRVPTDGTLWRGRLAAVSGWSIGTIT